MRKTLPVVTFISLSCVSFAQNAPAPAAQTPPNPAPKASWSSGSSYTLSGVPVSGAGMRRNAAPNTKDLPYDAHDLSGAWWVFGSKAGFTLSNPAPSMTSWGQAKFDQAVPGLSGPKARPMGNDPMMKCDPMGFPRILFYAAVPVENIQIPGRFIQFFDWFHTWRTVWTDGRELPKDPDPRWLGYSVGKWDGNTFVIESTGFDERSWTDFFGHPHSESAHITERYRRVDHDTLELNLVLDDPKAYTKPWVSETKTYKLDASTEIGEDFCVPSEEEAYRQLMREPAATPPKAN